MTIEHLLSRHPELRELEPDELIAEANRVRDIPGHGQKSPWQRIRGEGQLTVADITRVRNQDSLRRRLSEAFIEMQEILSEADRGIETGEITTIGQLNAVLRPQNTRSPR